jgi:hypothetical protein
MKTGILIVTVLSVVICGCTTGHKRTTHPYPFVTEISPIRYRVLEVTPQGEPKHGKQGLLLRVSPHYGKIDQKSLDFALEHETQELTMLISVNKEYDLQESEIIGFKAYQHLKR